MNDRYKNFYKILNEMDEKEHFENFMLFMLAPVVAGVKPSSTITLAKSSNDYREFCENGDIYLETLGLKSIVLREKTDAIILLIYNEENLKDRIYEDRNIDFFRNLNYDLNGNLDTVLSKLKERYNLYNCPHELGILLGIPVEDVKDFMNCTEKKCLACGYWKVFNNYDDAIRTFKSYDDSKNKVIELVLERKNIYYILSNIKDFNSNRVA